ncbi:hypothetical protein EXE43_22685, partial [Halorubrum sp. SS5]
MAHTATASHKKVSVTWSPRVVSTSFDPRLRINSAGREEDRQRARIESDTRLARPVRGMNDAREVVVLRYGHRPGR